MANRSLFGGAQQPAAANSRNAEGALAHALTPKQALAQLAMTGCLNQTFYASAQTQLDEVLAILARNPGAVVLPFNDRVRPWERRGTGVIETAQSLAALLGGGTAVSAPLEQLNRMGFAPDVLIVLSDNQSWIDARQSGATETQLQWERIKQRNREAKLICIDLQPYSNTQVPSQRQVLNVGGFSDAVFEVIAEFSAGRFGADHWVKQIEAVEV